MNTTPQHDTRVRIAFTMTRNEHDDLRRRADSEGLTIASLLRRAIATRRYLDARIQAGATVLIEQDGIQREVVFR